MTTMTGQTDTNAFIWEDAMSDGSIWRL